MSSFSGIFRITKSKAGENTLENSSIKSLKIRESQNKLKFGLIFPLTKKVITNTN